MKSNRKFSIKERLKSFEYAYNGLKIIIKEEHNFRIHLFITFLVLIVSFFLQLSYLEWVAIVFCIGFVFALEIFNSAIENIADFVEPNKHEHIKIIKDISAASVLVSAITAVVVAMLIFIPKIMKLLGC